MTQISSPTDSSERFPLMPNGMPSKRNANGERERESRWWRFIISGVTSSPASCMRRIRPNSIFKSMNFGFLVTFFLL